MAKEIDYLKKDSVIQNEIKSDHFKRQELKERYKKKRGGRQILKFTLKMKANEDEKMREEQFKNLEQEIYASPKIVNDQGFKFDKLQQQRMQKKQNYFHILDQQQQIDEICYKIHKNKLFTLELGKFKYKNLKKLNETDENNKKYIFKFVESLNIESIYIQYLSHQIQRMLQNCTQNAKDKTYLHFNLKKYSNSLPQLIQEHRKQTCFILTRYSNTFNLTFTNGLKKEITLILYF